MIDPQMLEQAKDRIAEALTSKTKGWRGPLHGKTINKLRHVHVQHVELQAGDLALVAQEVLGANPDKVPEIIPLNHTIFHMDMDVVALAKVKADSVLGLPPDHPVTIYADEAFHLLEAAK